MCKVWERFILGRLLAFDIEYVNILKCFSHQANKLIPPFYDFNPSPFHDLEGRYWPISKEYISNINWRQKFPYHNIHVFYIYSFSNSWIFPWPMRIYSIIQLVWPSIIWFFLYLEIRTYDAKRDNNSLSYLCPRLWRYLCQVDFLSFN